MSNKSGQIMAGLAMAVLVLGTWGNESAASKASSEDEKKPEPVTGVPSQ